MSDLNLRQALALLDSAERQIVAARALLGDASMATAAPQTRADIQAARGATGDACHGCGKRDAKQNTTPISAPVETFNCGECGYEYPTT